MKIRKTYLHSLLLMLLFITACVSHPQVVQPKSSRVYRPEIIEARWLEQVLLVELTNSPLMDPHKDYLLVLDFAGHQNLAMVYNNGLFQVKVPAYDSRVHITLEDYREQLTTTQAVWILERISEVFADGPATSRAFTLLREGYDKPAEGANIP